MRGVNNISSYLYHWIIPLRGIYSLNIIKVNVKKPIFMQIRNIVKLNHWSGLNYRQFTNYTKKLC